ncbi:phosphotransferase [Actinoplanes sp. NPDC026619]|uniref:phosphotransferase family protein n=1 Tax=Actinoplanes sp. NPDC026619 TaxID=3155798 RepID=UPI0033D9E782
MGGSAESVRRARLAASRPVRVGATMRRPRHGRSDYVDALLLHLAAAGFTGVPRPLGYDDQGRQILTYVEGDVPSVVSDAQIRSAAALYRAFHDATVSFPLLEDGAVVCHGDLGPHNTVFRGERAVAIIDFEDDVGPGRRVDDFAQAVWDFAGLADPAVAVPEQARRAWLACAAYGGVTPAEVVASLVARFGRARDQNRADGLLGAVRIFEDLLAWMARYGGEIADSRPAS